MSADELISPAVTLASDARMPGRILLEYPIPFDARFSSDMRFFFAGDFKFRTASAESASAMCACAHRIPATGADALSPTPEYASSSACAAGGRRLERRRAFSMRSGPMFDRRRETFSAAAAERGVAGGRWAGLLSLRRSMVGLGRTRGRCAPAPLPPLLLPVVLVAADGGSSANEFRLRSESARLSVLVALSLISSSSLRLPSVDAPRALKKPGSRRLPRRMRVGGLFGGSEKLSWTLSSVFSSSHSLSAAELLRTVAEKTELSSDRKVMEMEGWLLSGHKNIDGSRTSSRSP